MTLVKRNNGQSKTLRTSSSDLIERFDPFSLRSPWETRLFSQVPAMNVRENENEFLLELAAPGLKKNDFKVRIENDALSINVEKEEKREENEPDYSRREYSYNSFQRFFSLPGTVNAEKIEAKYEDGILKLVLPKTEEGKKQYREIKIS